MRTIFIVSISMALAVAQTAQQPPCIFTVAPSAEDPAILVLTLTALVDKAVTVVLRGLGDYTFRLKAKNGPEPVLTPLGEAVQKSNTFAVSSQVRELSLEKPIVQRQDLRELWFLTPGDYEVEASRGVFVGSESRVLQSTTTITIPAGYVQDPGCRPEAEARRAPHREQALLNADDVFGKPDALTEALAKPVGQLRIGPSHNPVSALADVAKAAHIAGGLAWSASTNLVCLSGARTVKAALEEIRATVPELLLDWQSPVVNLLDSRISDFLETRIARIEIPHPESELMEAIASVFSTPEMKGRANSLGLDDESHPRPMVMKPRPGSPISKFYDAEKPLLLENVTARQVLNAIMQRWGDGIWIYEELNRGRERRAFRIESMTLGWHTLQP